MKALDWRCRQVRSDWSLTGARTPRFAGEPKTLVRKPWRTSRLIATPSDGLSTASPQLLRFMNQIGDPERQWPLGSLGRWGVIGIAGLWEEWRDPNTRQTLHSYTMLTVNADTHEFMRNYHRPENEKRMVVILPRGLYRDWLEAPVEASADFMRRYPADRLAVEPSPPT